jgi:hypothetical protein
MRKKEKEGDLNIYSTKKLLNFPNNNNSKKSKTFECNCWVCKILDSVATEADTLRYEGYSIVSETGDSIFYNPLLLLNNIFNNNNNDKVKGEIYVSEEKIHHVVQEEDGLLAERYNGVNFNKIEY